METGLLEGLKKVNAGNNFSNTISREVAAELEDILSTVNDTIDRTGVSREVAAELKGILIPKCLYPADRVIPIYVPTNPSDDSDRPSNLRSRSPNSPKLKEGEQKMGKNESRAAAALRLDLAQVIALDL